LSDCRFLASDCRLRTTDFCLESKFFQTRYLVRRQIAEGPFRQITERLVAGSDPFQSYHRVAHAVEHAPYLAFPPFVDRDLKPGVGLFLSDLFDLSRSGLAVIEINTFLEVVYLAVFEHTLYLGQIGLGKLVLWMSDQVGEVSIIRQKEKSLGVVVQPADWIDANLDAFQQVLHRGPPFGVGHGRDKARGLVQHNIGLRLLGVDEFAVDLDMVFGWVGLGSELGHHLAVHAHPAFGDKLFRSSSGSHPRSGYDLLDTF
jgi:hypothetical protein